MIILNSIMPYATTVLGQETIYISNLSGLCVFCWQENDKHIKYISNNIYRFKQYTDWWLLNIPVS